MAEARVLSIQSHVVTGYVGNKIASFVLPLLGIKVDPCYSVIYSAHAGHPTRSGLALDASELRETVRGTIGRTRYDWVLLGYLGTAELVLEACRIVTVLQKRLPDLKVLVDPVMGDDGKMYVRPECVEAYRRHLLPLAHITTPNWYEAELLTGLPVGDETSAKKAVSMLGAAGGAEIPIITSLPDSPATVVGPSFIVRAQPVEGSFRGTGDLFTALLLATIIRCGSVRAACPQAVGVILAVLKRTSALAEAASPNLDDDGPAEECGTYGLELIACRDLIMNLSSDPSFETDGEIENY